MGIFCNIEIGPFVNNALIGLAVKDDVPIICLQDFWANHRWPSNKKMLPYYKAVCVLDEFSKKLWLEDGFSGEIHVTGSPAFDRFAGVDVSAEHKRLRRLFKLESGEKVILYVGQGVPRHIESDKKTFAFTIEALRALGARGLKLAARPHPRAVETGYYAEIARGLDLLDTSALPFTENILPLADVIISSLTTNLIHACHLRLPAVSILLPDAGRKTLKDIGLDDFPPNIVGATIGIYEENTDQLRDILNRVFNDENFRNQIRQAQEKNFPLDSGAAQKVAEAILSLE